jgi:hypothetical protein
MPLAMPGRSATLIWKGIRFFSAAGAARNARSAFALQCIADLESASHFSQAQHASLAQASWRSR